MENLSGHYIYSILYDASEANLTLELTKNPQKPSLDARIFFHNITHFEDLKYHEDTSDTMADFNGIEQFFEEGKRVYKINTDDSILKITSEFEPKYN